MHDFGTKPWMGFAQKCTKIKVETMPKRDVDSTSADKVLRLFILLLASEQKVYLSDLADKLNCSPQTIIRLIDVISNEVGDNLEVGKDGKYRWYRLKPANHLNYPSQHRLLRYLELIFDMTSQGMSEKTRSLVKRDILNLSVILNDEGSYFKTSGRVKYPFYLNGYIDYSRHLEILGQIVKASRDCQTLKLAHQRLESNGLSQILFAPRNITCEYGVIYVLGAELDEDASAVKSHTRLPLHRIESIELVDSRISPEVFKETVQPFYEDDEEKVRTYKIRFKPGKNTAIVRDRIWAKHQRVTDLDDGGFLLEITTTADAEVRFWVQGFGDDAALCEIFPL